MFDAQSTPFAQSQRQCVYPLLTSANHSSEICRVEFSPGKGGRTRGLPIEADFDGPRLYLENSEYHAIFTLQDREILQPGETTCVFVTFVYPSLLIGV
ncbi:hypothetical protein [Ktedonospora formicarum]|uniref:Uncharacterized protein n=1 Tax=Ktedonospora formicarum TaxID=2778364 RepID=A0A8J3HX33_9CHLR|nr:hypothetical protein [Ktedonospora formicarum]GHO42262.1 hypothetical protein KSX_04250 [Ktedonospora formicarum]